ncbi:MAG: methylenetetrahydrofolate reductase C-terminal domain-containing protein [Planctomycetes bacterium]|nr:methylenetetrahydrofolate reductase C-terminal domain-containing protein [Planctomycetota bacterium]
MIIQKQKAFEEIMSALEGEEKVFIFGCADCATACKTGGEDELAQMKQKLEEQGKQVTGTYVLDTACLSGEVRKRGKELKEQLDASDSVLVLACGTAVQTIGDGLEVIAHPGVDSLFIGNVVRLGKYVEKCSACGKCILEETGGICPVTRCAKGLMNGPCGGYSPDGKCEVDPEQDCAWLLIYERLRERGKLGWMETVKDPKDYSTVSSPRTLVWEHKKEAEDK